MRSKILVLCLCLVLVSFLVQTAEAATGLSVTIDTPVKEKGVSPGGTAIFPLTVKNTGTVDWEKLTLTRSEPPAGWKAEFHIVLVTQPGMHLYVKEMVFTDPFPPGTTMPPDVVSVLELQVTAPVTAEQNDKAVITVTATVVDGSGSSSSSEATAAVTVTAYVPEFPFGAALEIFFIPVIIYVWWKRKHKIHPNVFSS